jgi:hypothetical protein
MKATTNVDSTSKMIIGTIIKKCAPRLGHA